MGLERGDMGLEGGDMGLEGGYAWLGGRGKEGFHRSLVPCKKVVEPTANNLSSYIYRKLCEKYL